VEWGYFNRYGSWKKNSSQERLPFAISNIVFPEGGGMPQRIAILMLAALVYVGPQSTTQLTQKEAESHCELTQEDYAVYAVLITGLGRPEDPEEAWQGKEILIASLTAAPADTKSHWGGWGFRSNSKATPNHDTVVDFERKAHSLCELKPQFGDVQPYRVVTQEELDKVFKGGHWEDFYKKYPQAGGVWAFSRPGYNSARNQAVLYVSHACGSLCGTGHLYFLAKRNDRWAVQNRLMLWIS
jgi:hypothetical protein